MSEEEEERVSEEEEERVSEEGLQRHVSDGEGMLVGLPGVSCCFHNPCVCCYSVHA